MHFVVGFGKPRIEKKDGHGLAIGRVSLENCPYHQLANKHHNDTGVYRVGVFGL